MWMEMSANFSGPAKKPPVLKEIPVVENQDGMMYDDFWFIVDQFISIIKNHNFYIWYFMLTFYIQL